MSDKKLSLEDIFKDDDMGLLESKAKQSNVKTEDQRLIDSFEEINQFYEKEGGEPGNKSITEYKLASRLKSLRDDPAKIDVLKEHDRFNLLKAERKIESVEDILNDDSGFLDTDETLSIFKLKNVPQHRSETDYVGRRKAMDKEKFKHYEPLFQSVQSDLRKGLRSIKNFRNPEQNLKSDRFYILDGVLCYLNIFTFERTDIEEPISDSNRKDGRIDLIFENGTQSNMLYRSFGKMLLENGKIVTEKSSDSEKELFKNANLVNDEDVETGWIYVLKSKSTHLEIAQLKDLYKIGYSRVPVQDRIKNAAKESTYLNADVEIIATYKCYNVNPQKFENLLHRFFSEVCLSVDIHDSSGRRITPREWFVAPFGIIEKAINLILSGEIVNYTYDPENQLLIKTT